MPFTSPPDFADDEILDATRLNVLSDDIEYLYGLVSQISLPFAGMKGNAEVDDDDVTYYIWHAHQYLVHYFITNEDLGSDTDNNVIYYVNWGDPSAKNHIIYAGLDNQIQSGTIDLYAPASWPLYTGAWTAGSAYSDNASPNWGASPGDGHIVAYGTPTAHYKCETSHTGSTADLPGASAKWSLIGTPAMGEPYRWTFNLSFDSGVANRSYELRYIYEEL
jgi:hypothetical protein